MKSEFVKTNGINLHYLYFEGKNPPLILLHGVSANAHAFDGLIKAGLNKNHAVVSVDLRGRGLSDKPESGYTMEDHTKDILGLLDYLKIEKAILVGHSFGALLSLYMAYHYPDRVDKLVIMDAAAKLHPDTKDMLIPALSRLGQVYPSFEVYLDKIKNSPYLTFWDDSMESYYRADIKDLPDGTITTRSTAENITEALVKGSFGQEWLKYIQGVKQPAILINGSDNYALNAPLLPKEYALETVSMMKDCKYYGVSGNHQTMLYGQGAKDIVKAINEFLNQ